MHRQPHESRRSKIPLVLIGNGEFAQAWFAAPGGELYTPPPAPPNIPVQRKPPGKQPTDPNREPWSWHRFIIAVPMGMLLGLVIYAGFYAALTAIDLTLNAIYAAAGLR